VKWQHFSALQLPGVILVKAAIQVSGGSAGVTGAPAFVAMTPMLILLGRLRQKAPIDEVGKRGWLGEIT
jgi:hypothetical protein